MKNKLTKKIHSNRIYVSILTLILLSSILGCRKIGKEEFQGDKIRPASSSFNIIGNNFTASNNNPNFNVDSVDFSSSFNEEVTWTITITGLVSGAVKEIKGTTDYINSTNANWNGNSSNVYFFRQGEVCYAKLSILGSEKTIQDTITVFRSYNYHLKTRNGIKYTLLDDIDGNGVPMNGVSKDAFDQNVVMTADTTNKVQGVKAFKMSGFDFNKNSWSGGLSHNTLLEMGAAGVMLESTDPAQVYFNVYVYGTGQPNSAIQIKLYEIDDQENIDNINVYTYDQSKNDAWTVDVPVTWVGWKLVSKKYSTFTNAKDPLAGGSGNKIKEPHKVTAGGVSLLSLPDPGAETSLSIDYIILTEGGPFIP